MLSNRQHRPSHSIENTLLVLFCSPVILFIVTWFRIPAAIFAGFGLLLVLWRILCCRVEESDSRKLSRIDWCLILLVAVCWISLSGTAGIGFQNWDHEKHNAMMNDLVRKDWPVRYESDRFLLVYYLPYYLIPAFVGKAAGWVAANVVLMLQLLVFVTLTLAWLVRRAGARGRFCILATVVLFIFFSGCDWIGTAYHKGWPVFPKHLEWWTRFNYISVTSQLFWLPNSAIASWTGTALFLDALERRSLLRSFIVWLITLFWCPYVAAGMLPFLLMLRFSLDDWEKYLRIDWRWTFALLPAAFLGIAYYGSKSSGIPFGAIWMQPSSIRGFAFDYVKFLVLHVLWAAPFLWYFKRKIGIPSELWRLFIISCGILIVLPFAIAPGINDFIMKASMPALLVLAVAVITVIVQFLEARHDSPARSRQSRWVMSVLMIIYLFGSLTAVHEIGRSIMRYQARIPPFYSEDRLPVLKPDWVPLQYMSEGSSLLRFLLRDSAP
ncbi:MAG: hypothetical protein JXA73_08005 [Acidobacteria bacterium]|nr:hypothetical protein [Acidobacteriota bacterium]